MINRNEGQSNLLNIYSPIETKISTEVTRQTLVLLLAGGEGSRLGELTKWRAKPAVPFAGKYRMIDFTLSNCVNSGLRRVGVLTQYKSHSLIRHLQHAWSFLRAEIGEFVEIIPAQQRMSKEWYRGTADALYQNLDIIHRHSPKYVLVLGGDHIYTMDYSNMLMQHVRSKADMTVACIEVPREKAREFGVMSVDENLSITRFTEKPSHPEAMPDKPDTALASMGIYVFSTRFLYDTLIEDAKDEMSSHDFGKNIIPRAIPNSLAKAYPYRNEQGKMAYWRDVGTLDAYWEANIELCSIEPELNLYNQNWPIWTYQVQLPPAKFVFDDEGRRGVAIDSLISSGCIIAGAHVKRSVIFSASRIETGSLVKDSVILPGVYIGKNCRIIHAVIDKGTLIPDNTVIGEDHAEDAKRFHISEGGVVLVTPEMMGQDIMFGSTSIY
ncbi:MAG: glucose-1-phosphate adenylyltransferase [Syntrophaceae bacterium]|nr:MAG: glucose-1-phosphate adenylyltransferase [Syntrophaceae bacterium]